VPAQAHYLAEELRQVPGLALKYNRPFFKEFTVQVPGSVPGLLERLLKAGYHAGLDLGRWYPGLKNCISIAVTEKRTKKELDGLAAAFKAEVRY
jgi:glycine dehydrogenase subunit 1